MRGTLASLSTLAGFAAACSLTTDLPEPGNGAPQASPPPSAEQAPECDDARACTTCVQGITAPLAVGTTCDEDGGSWCDGQGRCVECLASSDCTNQPGCAGEACICSTGHCMLERCTNGTQDSDETDVDCGGALCDPCDEGETCKIASDCVSVVCAGGRCAAPTCTDEVANGTESDLDCVGVCNDCGPGQACNDASDCDSGVCASDTFTCAAPDCDDGVSNGTETGVDCGSSCDGCGPGEPCANDADCLDPYHCTSGTCTAALPYVQH